MLRSGVGAHKPRTAPRLPPATRLAALGRPTGSCAQPLPVRSPARLRTARWARASSDGNASECPRRVPKANRRRLPPGRRRRCQCRHRRRRRPPRRRARRPRWQPQRAAVRRRGGSGAAPPKSPLPSQPCPPAARPGWRVIRVPHGQGSAAGEGSAPALVATAAAAGPAAVQRLADAVAQQHPGARARDGQVGAVTPGPGAWSEPPEHGSNRAEGQHRAHLSRPHASLPVKAEPPAP